MSDKFIGTRIKAARERLHWSQVKLASEINVRSSAVSQWEAAKTMPTPENVQQLAIKLDVPFEWLATGRGSPNFGVESQALSFLQDPALRVAVAGEHSAAQINQIFQILVRLEAKIDALSAANHASKAE